MKRMERKMVNQGKKKARFRSSHIMPRQLQAAEVSGSSISHLPGNPNRRHDGLWCVARGESAVRQGAGIHRLLSEDPVSAWARLIGGDDFHYRVADGAMNGLGHANLG